MTAGKLCAFAMPPAAPAVPAPPLPALLMLAPVRPPLPAVAPATVLAPSEAPRPLSAATAPAPPAVVTPARLAPASPVVALPAPALGAECPEIAETATDVDIPASPRAVAGMLAAAGAATVRPQPTAASSAQLQTTARESSLITPHPRPLPLTAEEACGARWHARHPQVLCDSKRNFSDALPRNECNSERIGRAELAQSGTGSCTRSQQFSVGS